MNGSVHEERGFHLLTVGCPTPANGQMLAGYQVTFHS